MFVHQIKGFAKNKEVPKLTILLIEMANNFNLAMDKGDIEKILEAVPEELTIEKLLELEEKHIAKGKVRGNKTAGKEEKVPPRKFTVKVLGEAFEDLDNLLKKFENMDINNKMF